ncbi:MAG: UDP-N-acetylmuramoyl-L-alanyl-D-glutamate--2,6-diaminopimelate ligase [Gammaproteobacteria bacterium]
MTQLANPAQNATFLEEWVPDASQHLRNITGLSSDSRLTQAGDLFIASAGPAAERMQYIEQAIAKGAVGVLRSADSNQAAFTFIDSTEGPIPTFSIPQLEDKVGWIAAKFYGDPSITLTMIGITGTNGKTSTSCFIANALQAVSLPCGVIGTLGHGFPGHIQAGQLTTPDPIQLQQQLASLKHQGAKAVAMEVSSHSLAQKRVAGVAFNIGVFTNLTQDHLDYHHTMENYAAAKRQLFLQPGLKYAVINADDPVGLTFLKEFSSKLICFAYGTQPVSIPNVVNILAEQVKQHSKGFSAWIKTPWGEGKLDTHLLGQFNLYNLLAALTTLGILEIPLETALNALSQLSTVPGRMQAFGGGSKPLVVVDYAHTPDALEKALLALRPHCHGKLWCVFGCGGNRDTSKRKLMGQAAEHYSDHIIITNDNPRFEDPEAIIQEITAGLVCPWAAEIEPNREAAIAHAIHCAEPGDVVLIAGKGHEPYQIIGEQKLPFNDAEQVQLHLHLKYT